MLLNVLVVYAVVIGLNHAASAAAAWGAPGLLRIPVYVVLLCVLAVLGSRLQFVTLEPVLFALEGVPALRSLVGRSWTARFPRYRCPGFRPGPRRRVS